MKLDIGGGRTPQPGYTNVDIIPEVNPDICAPMWELPVPDESVSEIYSSHALEHIEKAQVVPTLKEWKRVLQPGGTIDLQVPDLVWCCNNWLNHMTNDWHMDVLFGNQEHPGEIHKTGFTRNIMASYLDQAGLKLDNYSVIQSHNQDTLRFMIHKP